MQQAYKLFYNEETNQVDYKVFYLKHANDFSNEPETNFYEALHCHCVSVDSAIEASCSYTNAMHKGSVKLHKCKDCGIFFLTDCNEETWYKNRGLTLPKRCIKCRKKRKAEISN